MKPEYLHVSSIYTNNNRETNAFCTKARTRLFGNRRLAGWHTHAHAEHHTALARWCAMCARFVYVIYIGTTTVERENHSRSISLYILPLTHNINIYTPHRRRMNRIEKKKRKLNVMCSSQAYTHICWPVTAAAAAANSYQRTQTCSEGNYLEYWIYVLCVCVCARSRCWQK